ncbi:hypothetical protein HZB94_01560 [Candidatus Falkowbacteria bacterium]|nr:hypothetical protein [Candidatus Falkowbacteria bacterium]
MTKKICFVLGALLVVSLLIGAGFVHAKSIQESLKGKILLQVEENGEAWYVHSTTLLRYYLGRPADAFQIMKDLGLGVTHAYISSHVTFPASVVGKILIDVEESGKAYYIYPKDKKAYYLGKPDDAFQVMRDLGLGISNDNLNLIVIAPKSKVPGVIQSKYSCGACAKDEKCGAGKCQKLILSNQNFCGNYSCEAGESYNGLAEETFQQCSLDCPAPASGGYSNEYVKVECGCAEYNVLSKRHGCVKDAKKCDDCGPQEALFSEVQKIQTDVVKCLSDYFQFKPNRLVYKVFYNPDLEKCSQKNGCTGIEGGVGGPDYVMFHNLNGFRAYGQVVPTKVEYLTSDVHETTHYFIYQMLHAPPSWFQEALAIQTNERLNCSNKQTSDGDAYLQEKGNTSGGINMSAGVNLNSDFYKKFKAGKVSLNSAEKKDHYIVASLFLMGLKQDYNCSADCVKDAVIKLREFEQNACMSGSGANCSIVNAGKNWLLMGLNGSTGEDITKANALIKQKFEEVIGKDISALFDLVGLVY